MGDRERESEQRETPVIVAVYHRGGSHCVLCGLAADVIGSAISVINCFDVPDFLRAGHVAEIRILLQRFELQPCLHSLSI